MKSNSRINKDEFFREVTLRLCSSLDFNVVLRRLLDYIKDFVPVDGIFLGVHDMNASILHIRAKATFDTVKITPSRIVYPQKYHERIKDGWGRKKHLIINDIDLEEPWIRDVLSLNWSVQNKSLITTKLKLEGQWTGVLTLYVKGKNRYTEDHLHLVSMLREPGAIAFSNALKHHDLSSLKEILADDSHYFQQQLLDISGNSIIGENSGLKTVMAKVRQVSPMDSPVLLLGETGVGKEVIANVIHQTSRQKDGPIIKVNCGAIPDALFESELFGHEKGAFTGATNQKRGRFERAHNGTIFLDEIGELPLSLQVKLMRVLQTKEIERVGGSSTIPVNCRIIIATNRNLEEMVGDGRFREDLWFRINVFPIMIPPLRQRKVDIPILAKYFVKKKSSEMNIRNIPPVDRNEIEKLLTYHWPGNVRELENIVERSLICSQGGYPNGRLHFEIPDNRIRLDNHSVISCRKNEFPSFDQIIKLHIKQALRLSDGKIEGKEGAAQLLRLNPHTLRSKMKKLGVPYGRKRNPP